MNFGVEASFGFGSGGGSGGGTAWNNITGKPSTTQFYFVVGGANNFASIPGAPAVPIAGAVGMTTSILTGFACRMSRTGLNQMGINPANGNSYFTKVQASSTINWSPALASGEEIVIETVPL